MNLCAYRYEADDPDDPDDPDDVNVIDVLITTMLMNVEFGGDIFPTHC